MSGKVRVLMVLEDWGLGGTQEYVQGLGRYLSRLDRFEVAVAVLRKGHPGARQAIGKWAGEVAVLERGVPGALLPLRQLGRAWRPHVWHNHLYTSLLPATLLARGLRVPRVVTTLHMPLRQWSWRHRLMWRMAIGLSHRLVGVSRDVLESVGRREGSSSACVIPAALPQPTTLSVDRAAGSDRDVFVVCGTGRLAREKDWPTLLRAFAAFSATIEAPARLVLFGDGPLRDELRRLAATLGIADAVELRGRVPRSDLLAELSRMDLFVLPSRFEGLGIAAIEAMQQGVPTIAADFGASRDFIEHGQTGHRFPIGDWSALAGLIRWHYDNREPARAIGASGQAFVLSRFSEEKTFGLYPSVYGAEGLSMLEGRC